MDEAKQKTNIDSDFQKGLANQMSDELRRKQKLNQYYADLKMQQGMNPMKIREMEEREHMKNHLRSLSQAGAE